MEIVVVKETDNIAKLVNNAQEGTEFLFPDFVYRNFDVLRPKDRTVLRNLKLNGSKIITGWLKESGYWISPEPATIVEKASIEFLRNDGKNTGGYDRANWNLALFRDDLPLRHVSSITELDNGSWYFEEGSKTIWIYFDPKDHLIELTQKSKFIESSANEVVLDSCYFEKSATKPQSKAIINYGGSWHIVSSVFAKHAGCALRISNGTFLDDCKFINNGQMGAGFGSAIITDVIIKNCYFGYNNFQRVNEFWEACGIKVSKTENIVIDNSIFEFNIGNGLWFDIDNKSSVIQKNKFYYNDRNGLYNEIGQSALVSNNVAVGNGNSEFYNSSEAQMRITLNQDVIYKNNILVTENEKEWGFLIEDKNRGSWKTENIRYENNYIFSENNQAIKIITDAPDGEIQFNDNFYSSGSIVSYKGTNYTIQNWNSKSFVNNEKEIVYPEFLKDYLEKQKTEPISIQNNQLVLEGKTMPSIGMFYIVDAENSEDMYEYAEGSYTLSVSEMPKKFSIRVDLVDGNQVVFLVNDVERIEKQAPYAIFNNDIDFYDGLDSVFGVWNIFATPYLDGVAGETKNFILTISDGDVIEIGKYRVTLKSTLPLAGFDVYLEEEKISNINVAFEQNEGGNVEVTID